MLPYLLNLNRYVHNIDTFAKKFNKKGNFFSRPNLHSLLVAACQSTDNLFQTVRLFRLFAISITVTDTAEGMPQRKKPLHSRLRSQTLFINHMTFVPARQHAAAKADHQSHIKGIEEGADAYFEKPFNMDELEASIASIINNRNPLYYKLGDTLQIQSVMVSPF